jgi:hypothetical protein
MHFYNKQNRRLIMKCIRFTVYTVLILGLACGSGGSEEGTVVQEVTEQLLPDTAETAITGENVLIAEEDSGTLYLLQNGSAGLFTAGLTKDQVEEFSARYGNVEVREIDLQTEGMPAPALELTFNNSGTVVLELDESGNTAGRITVNSSLFATEYGIRVGSTYSDLNSSYEFDGLQWGDGGEPVAIVEEEGMSFLIAQGDWWQAGVVEGDIPGDIRVTGIILW